MVVKAIWSPCFWSWMDIGIRKRRDLVSSFITAFSSLGRGMVQVITQVHLHITPPGHVVVSKLAVPSCWIMSSPNNSIRHSFVPLCPFLHTLLAAFMTLFYGYWNFLLLIALYGPNVLYSRQFILKILKILLGDGHLTWNHVSHRWFILCFIGSLQLETMHEWISFNHEPYTRFSIAFSPL